MHIPLLPRHARAGRRPLTRLAAATVVAAAGCLLTASPASAHTTLVAAKPAKGAKVASPAQIKLTYAGPVRFPGVVLLDAKGGHHESGKAHATNATVTEKVAGVLPPGVYTVGWRVVAEDGHPVTGEYKFTVVGGTASAPAAASTPAPVGSAPDSEASAAATPSSTPAAQRTSNSSSAGWWWVGLGAVLVVAAVIGAELGRKRRIPRN